MSKTKPAVKIDSGLHFIQDFLTEIRHKITSLSIFNSNLSGCKNCRALGVAMIRYLKIFSLPYSVSAMIFSKFSSCK